MALPEFDAANPRHADHLDEMSLWSSLAGALLLEHVPLTARAALDVGCGTGFPLLELAERLGPGAFVAGVDPWRAALARAAARRATWAIDAALPVAADAVRLPFRDRTFDLVVSNLGVNNFADPAAALAECARVLVSGGTLALATNVVGHFRELYDTFAEVLADDADASARLAAHVAHRATVTGLRAQLAAGPWRVEAVHERTAWWRVRDGTALFVHHFIRLGFLPAWRDVAGDGARLDELRLALDRRARAAGALALSVPLAVVLARRA